MENNPSQNRFFIYPHVQKHDEIHAVIASMESFRQSLGETDRALIDYLISYADAHSSQSHLLPYFSPFEFVLLTILIEVQRKLTDQEKTHPEPKCEPIHPPFP